MSCLSVCWGGPAGEVWGPGQGTMGVWGPGIGGSRSLEKCSSCQEFSNPATWRGDTGKNYISEDNIGIWILKTFLSKNDHFSLKFF